jgi:hypothetical protein
LLPAVSKELYQLHAIVSVHEYLLCPESSTARVLVASKDMRMQSFQPFEGSYTVLLYANSYTIICTYIELLNDIYTARLLYLVKV